MLDGGNMGNVGIVYYVKHEKGLGVVSNQQKGDESMVIDEKISRRQKIRRDRQEKFNDDRIRERVVKKPRIKNIQYYDYSEWDE